jgi:predicted DCC family thiol-disulfide oxidoreductase YuxK
MKTDIATTALPQPADRPGASVLIYDGQCNLCTAQVKRIARWDSRGELAFWSLHDPEVYRRYPDLKHDDLMRQMVLVDPLGRRHWGAAALRQLSRRIPRLWPLVPLLHLPGSLPLWQWAYNQVARRRYLFNRHDCDGGTCNLHGR